MTRDEVKTLIQHIPNYRHKLMVVMAYSHGLRVSELISLKGEDVQGGYVKVQRLKGSLKTVQPYVHSEDPDLDEAAALTMLAVTTKSKDKLFDITRNGFLKVIKRAGKVAGIPEHKLHPHALKHSTAMNLIGTTGIENVRQYLGHKSIASTGAYLRVSDEAASKAAAAAFL
jgi:integrase